MRICMVGAGVIGTIYGQLLTEAGHDVTHYIRPGHGDPYRGGLKIDLLDGRSEATQQRTLTYRPPVTEDLGAADPFHLIVAPVRHYQLPTLLPTLAAQGGDADFLFMGNLWTSFDPVDSHLAGRYRWALPVAGGGWRDGALEAAVLDEIDLGDPLGGRGSRLHLTTRLFQHCGLSVTRQLDTLDWLWCHFAIEAGMIAAAAKAGGVERFHRDIDALTEGVWAVRDALTVVQARGVDIESRPEARMFFAPAHSVATSLYDFYAEDAAANRAVTAQTGTLEQHRIFFDLLSTGRQLAVHTPILSALEPYVEGLLAATA